jgi:predicted nucleotidyltransferase component of viral defense system
MISKQEVIDLAHEFSLDVNTIEKDYVLGWLLAGIEHHRDLFGKWIFKGGTCLKKCYFETYRFSEDLDYTLIDENQIDNNFLSTCFKDIANWIYETVGIEIPEDTIQFKIKRNQAGRRSVEGKVGYIGPMQRRRDPVRIKLDLTADELLAMPPDLRTVHHPYSDNPDSGIKSYCYSFTEVFAEKLRALGERARPRDLYDVIHLFRHADQTDNAKAIFETLKKKCDFKSIPVPTMAHLEVHPKRNELETEWGNMLAHQLPALPALADFWQELPNMFDWLHGKTSNSQLDLIPSKGRDQERDIDPTWQPPSMIHPWRTTIPFELIRYAAANHLCVELDYQKKDHTIKKYLIEPYDLKRTKDGYLLLVALKHQTNEWRSFLVNGIKSIKVTQTQFIPQYRIGLTPFLFGKIR